MIRRTILALVVLVTAVPPASAQLSLTQVASGFSSPLALTGAPNDPDTNRAFVLERGGLIRTMNLTTGAATGTFLNLPQALTQTSGGTVLQNGEEGLLGMAFSQTYSAAGTGFLYVNYVGSTPGGNVAGETRIDRFTVTGGILDQTSRANILTIVQPAGQTNHKGGWLGFNPTTTDNHLYVATGDGGGGNDPGNRGQNNTQLLGKLIRINPNTTGTGYTIPATNPNFGAGTRQEIFATGLRNPFRNSFDRATGNLYIGDVGQSTREEIDFIPNGSAGGQNFGWRLREGRDITGGGTGTPGIGGPPPPGNVEPIYDYTRALGDGAVTGGFVYRGGDILDGGQSLDGTYLFGDFVSGRISSFRYTGTDIPTGGATDRNLQAVFGGFQLAAFGQDNFGRMYALGLNGTIYRFTGTPIPEPTGTLTLCAAVGGGWLWRRKRNRPA